MNVRVILQRAAPRVQHAEETTSCRTDVLGVSRHVLDRFAGGIEQRGIGDTLVTANYVTQRGRNGERQQKVGTRQ